MKFKVGDKVRCIEYKKIFNIIKIETDPLRYYIDAYPFVNLYLEQDNIELVERKIGDKWYKAEELNEDGMPIDSHIGKIPVEGVDFYMTEVNKEEFKIDNLGWYEDDVGRKLKHLHTHKSNSLFPHSFLLVDDIIRVQSNGEFYHEFIKNKIIKYLGPELQKEPRKFEFEAWIGENPTNRNGLESIDRESALDSIFGYSCGHKLVIDRRSYHHHHYERTTKWKVTMEELPCDSE